MLRRSGKPVVLGANKADNPARRQEAVEFYALGLGEPITLSSISGTGTGDLLDAITELLPPPRTRTRTTRDGRAAGRHRRAAQRRQVLAGQRHRRAERVIVSDIPGTTRDAIDTEVEHKGQPIVLIDTAGIRRRGHIGPGVEKYSVLRADRAIDRSDVAVLMIDGVEGITAQDTHIAGYIHDAAKGIIVVINKWDIVRERLREAERLADPDRRRFAQREPVELRAGAARREGVYGQMRASG